MGAVEHCVAADFLYKSGVMGAEITGGRNCLASAAIAEPRGAERSRFADAKSVTPSSTRARGFTGVGNRRTDLVETWEVVSDEATRQTTISVQSTRHPHDQV
jgi:hypothetical protein